jgi:hypothetical protein
MLFDGKATDNLTTRPECDICKSQGAIVGLPAIVDGHVIGVSSWAYMCDTHFCAHGQGLGLGVGQVLLCGDTQDEQLKVKFHLTEGVTNG